MVATDAGIIAIEGGDRLEPGGVVLWTINATTCAAQNRNYGFSPVDPQDLALGSDGSIWVGDIGDGIGSDNNRTRLTFEKVQPGGTAQAVPHRVAYPAAGPFHAEAMVMQADDVPVVFVNESGKVGIYTPSGPLVPNTTNGLPTMTRVGEFVPVRTGTKNPLGNIGNALVTGAARSPDGSKVVVRTASDAYEFPVANGNVVKAITDGKPRITPLPSEENGQAIAYSADGTKFLTLTSSAKPKLRSYTPYVPVVPAGVDNAVPEAPAADRGFLAGLSFSDITLIGIIVSLLGLGSVAAGIIGIVRYRKSYQERYGDSEDSTDGTPGRPGRGRGPNRRPGRGPDGRPRRPGDEDGFDEGERSDGRSEGWEDDPDGRIDGPGDGRHDRRRGRPRQPDERGRPRHPDERGPRFPDEPDPGRTGRSARPPVPTGGDAPHRTGTTYGSPVGGSPSGSTYGSASAGPAYGPGPAPTDYGPGPGPVPDYGPGPGPGAPPRGRPSGGGSTYRGAARVGPPPEPPDGPPPEPRRPAGGQVYGSNAPRYPEDDGR